MATFVISSVAHPDSCLDVQGGVCHNGIKVASWGRHGGPNQSWILESAPAGGFYLRSFANPAFVLDLSSGASKPSNGQVVHVWGFHGFPNQRWLIEPSGTGSVVIKSAHSPEYVLDLDGGHAADGTRIFAWSRHNHPNQR